MPSVVEVGKRLAVLYDAPGGTSACHMKRDIGFARPETFIEYGSPRKRKSYENLSRKVPSISCYTIRSISYNRT